MLLVFLITSNYGGAVFNKLNVGGGIDGSVHLNGGGSDCFPCLNGGGADGSDH
jgi:hypothetical protein